MPTFGPTSRSRLAGVDPELRRLCVHVVQRWDCTVLCGHRGKAEQLAALASGASQLGWPQSKHNAQPSLAVDLAPWPLPSWGDAASFRAFGFYVVGTAAGLGIPLRWGGLWAGVGADWRLNGFDDLVHFELVGEV